MPKVQRRKPPRRPPPKPTPPLDADLTELALALDTGRREQDPEEWFKLPWRDGRNAMDLALDVAISLSHAPDKKRYLNEVRQTLKAPPAPHSYEVAEETLLQLLEYDEPSSWRLAVRAAIRCRQLWLSTSHGGGHGYNAVLSMLATFMTPEQMLGYRCKDAIGVYPYLCNDMDDNLRRAFAIAWNRGLFQTAYSLPRSQGVP